MLVNALTSTPSAFMSTRNSEMSLSRPLDPVRTATMTKSAMAPSGTGFLTPLRLPPEADSLIASGDGLPLPSNSASVPIALPPAIAGSHFCFCASLPASRIASAARYTVEENGTGASARPISSAITQSSRCPAPAPPNSSGIATPRKPISARPFHSARSYGSLPSSTVRTAFGGHFSARNFRASSRSCFCSSEKSKFMACYSACVRYLLFRVVPAKAGTHNHRWWFFREVVAQRVSIARPRRMGPRLRGDDVDGSVQNNHILSGMIGIEPLHQLRAALEAGALVDIALVGEFIAVDRCRLDHQHRTRDPHA